MRPSTPSSPPERLAERGAGPKKSSARRLVPASVELIHGRINGVVDSDSVMARLADSGMLLASARGPIANVAEIVAGEPITGSWWGHPAGHCIYNELGALDESPDVIRMRLVKGKVTLVHRRVWPALARVAEAFTAKQLAVLHEVHIPSGAHRVDEQPFEEWLPADVAKAARKLTAEQAWAQLPECLAPRTT